MAEGGDTMTQPLMEAHQDPTTGEIVPPSDPGEASPSDGGDPSRPPRPTSKSTRRPSSKSARRSTRRRNTEAELYWANEMENGPDRRNRSGTAAIASGATQAIDYIKGKFEPYYMLATAVAALLDIVSDFAVAIGYVLSGDTAWAVTAFSIIGISGILVNVFEYYANEDKKLKPKYVLLNFLHIRVVWAALRAGLHGLFGLFAPSEQEKNLSNSVRDLKVWEAFFESGPQLLLQTYTVIVTLAEAPDSSDFLPYFSILSSTGSIAIAALTFEVEMFDIGVEVGAVWQGLLVVYHFASVLFLGSSSALFACCFKIYFFLALFVSIFVATVIFYCSAFYVKSKKRKRNTGESLNLDTVTTTLADSRLWAYPLFSFFTSSLLHVRYRGALNALLIKNLIQAAILYSWVMLSPVCHLQRTYANRQLAVTEENFPDQYRNTIDLNLANTQVVIYMILGLWFLSVMLGTIIKIYFKFAVAKAKIKEREDAERERQEEMRERRRRTQSAAKPKAKGKKKRTATIAPVHLTDSEGVAAAEEGRSNGAVEGEGPAEGGGAAEKGKEKEKEPETEKEKEKEKGQDTETV